MKVLNYFIDDKQIEPDIKYSGIAKYMPIIICGGYFLITIILFAFGPFDWKISNKFSLYSFLILAFLSLVTGYVLGVKIKIKKTKSNFNINRIICISFIVFIIMYVLNTYATTGNFFPDIIKGLFNSGEAYGNSHTIKSGFSSIIIYLGIIIAPITSLITPLYFLYYQKLSLTSKILGTLVLFLNLLVGISQGVINSFATITFQIIMFLLIYLFSNTKNNFLKKSIKIFIIIFSILFCFFSYYKTVMGNRLVGDVQNNNNNNELIDKDIFDDNISKDKENIIIESNDNITSDLFNGSAEAIAQAQLKEKHLFSFLPDTIEGSCNHITSYITHGYKGLSIALDSEFTSSYGLGFSDFLRHNFLKLIGKSDVEDSIYQRTYMYKLEQSGWVAGNVWVSFFVYPASDIGFPLTILLMFVIGLVFSLSWRDTLQSKNIFAAVIFMNLCMVICFLSANNVYFQNGGPFLTFFSMGILWIISKKFGKEA